VTRFAKVAEALRHAGRQVCLIEVGEPRRVIFAGRAVKRPLCLGKSGAAGMGIVAGGVAVCLHDQALGQQGRRTVPDGSGLGGSREVDCLVWPGEVERLVRLSGKDLCR